MVKLYTDGSCLGNPGKGGWGVVCLGPTDEVIFKLCGGENQVTNNIMELTAVIRGLKKAHQYGYEEVEVITDSKYVMDGITKWIHNWIQNNWKTSTNKDVKNKTLWKKLYKLMNSNITFSWVKAHTGNKWNEVVDSLARNCASLI
jgi:ribonuclease HI